jgi:hypothetical protein
MVQKNESKFKSNCINQYLIFKNLVLRNPAAFLALIAMEILLCWRSAQKIAMDSRISF